MTQHAHVLTQTEPTLNIQNDWEGWRTAMLQSPVFMGMVAKMHDTFMTQFNTAIDFAKAGHLRPITVIYKDIIGAYQQQEQKKLKQLSERFCLPSQVVELHSQNGHSNNGYR
ncbi:MAG: hypothetical protein AAFU71_12040 [Cyanobacteria bacterium J06632_22]